MESGAKSDDFLKVGEVYIMSRVEQSTRTLQESCNANDMELPW